MAITMEVRGTQELRRALMEAGKRAEAALGAALYQEGQAIMTESKREVPVDEGILRASGYVNEPTAGTSGPEVELGYGGAAKGYAVYVHEGTGPAVGRPRYFPPIAALKGWAKRVLGDESAAYAVARAIYVRGTRPRKFLEGPFRRRVEGMASRLATRVRRAIEAQG